MTTIETIAARNGTDTGRYLRQQVKMFIHKDPEDAEKAISRWLNENDVSIVHIGQSQSEKGGNFVFILTLFYRNKCSVGLQRQVE